MNTWVLVIMVSMGTEYKYGALNSTVIPGFTTQQACENAKNNIHTNELGFSGTKKVKVVSKCVPTTI